MEGSIRSRLFASIAASISIPFACGKAFAFPMPDQMIPQIDLEDLENLGQYDFRGILASSRCSASLVRFEDALLNEQALVLTNGHCVKLIDPGTVMSEQPSSRTFDVLDADAHKIGQVNAQELVYATMTKSDIAIYRLEQTYNQILGKFGIEALTLAHEPPALEQKIDVISGYWRRGFSCHVESQVDTLIEAGWRFVGAIRYSRPGCEVIGGTSGSPVIASGTKTVVAINNTINQSGKKCELNNPCEVDKNGKIIYAKGFGYAQQTYWLYSCRNADGQLDFKTEGCQLPTPFMQKNI